MNEDRNDSENGGYPRPTTTNPPPRRPKDDEENLHPPQMINGVRILHTLKAMIVIPPILD